MLPTTNLQIHFTSQPLNDIAKKKKRKIGNGYAGLNADIFVDGFAVVVVFVLLCRDDGHQKFNLKLTNS